MREFADEKQLKEQVHRLVEEQDGRRCKEAELEAEVEGKVGVVEKDG